MNREGGRGEGRGAKALNFMEVDDVIIRKRNWRSDWIGPIYDKINGINGSRVKSRLPPPYTPPPPLMPEIRRIYHVRKRWMLDFVIISFDYVFFFFFFFFFWVFHREPIGMLRFPVSSPASSVPGFRNWSCGIEVPELEARERITVWTGSRGCSIPASAAGASFCRRHFQSHELNINPMSFNLELEDLFWRLGAPPPGPTADWTESKARRLHLVAQRR